MQEMERVEEGKYRVRFILEDQSGVILETGVYQRKGITKLSAKDAFERFLEKIEE